MIIAWVVFGLLLAGFIAVMWQGWRLWNESWDQLCRNLGLDPAEERKKRGMRKK